jgi:hypothetical protein
MLFQKTGVQIIPIRILSNLVYINSPILSKVFWIHPSAQNNDVTSMHNEHLII